MTFKRFLSPVNLRKNSVPLISIYGDGEDRELTKLIWSFIPGYDVKISNPTTPEELYNEAYGSAVVFVVVKAVSYTHLTLPTNREV